MPPLFLYRQFGRNGLVTQRFIGRQILFLFGLMVSLVGCQVSSTTSPDIDKSPLDQAGHSPLPFPVQVTPTFSVIPTQKPLSGVSSEVIHYVGVTKYLVVRLPTDRILEQWNVLTPPPEMQSSHQEFQTSIEQYIAAHQAFNDSVFGRSATSLDVTRDALNLAMQNHKQAGQIFEQQLDLFMQKNYNISSNEVLEISVPVEP